MAKLSQQDMDRLLNGVKEAVRLVESDGFSPDDAIAEAAKKFNYGPGYVKMACSAFNTGRQLSQWKSEKGILGKTKSFDLASYDNVIEKIWGDKKASDRSVVPCPDDLIPSYSKVYPARGSAVDLSKTFAKPQEKTASVFSKVPDEKRLKSAIAKCTKNLDELRAEKCAAEDRLIFATHSLKQHFSKFSPGSKPVAVVEKFACRKFGDAVKFLFDSVISDNTVKRAADYSESWSGFQTPIDYSSKPYTIICDCVKYARKISDCAEKVAQVEKDIDLLNSCLPLNLLSSKNKIEKSSSFLGGALGYGLASQAGEYMKSLDDEKAKQVDKMLSKLEDPLYQNQLRAIKARTALVEAMSDPENPISGYDPEDVLRQYNRISSVAPEISTHAETLEPALRKRLAGLTEPFESQALIQTELDTLKGQAIARKRPEKVENVTVF